MALAPSRRFTVNPVGEGVWVAEGTRSAGVTSNAGIVDLGNVTLVVDSFLTLQAAQELRTAARILTGRDASAVVNTHWHLDHWLGNSMFADCEIYSTVPTRDRILEVGTAMLPCLQGEVAAQRLRSIERKARDESRPGFKEELESEVAAGTDLYEMYRSLTVQAPNQTHPARFNLPARRSVWFVEVRGHTESDTMVFVPEAEVLFTGDIVTVGVHPNLASGDVGEWLTALAGVEKIAPRTVVPGHGPPAELGACQMVRDYLQEIRRLAPQPLGAEVPIPAEFADWSSPSLFEQNIGAFRLAPGRSASP